MDQAISAPLVAGGLLVGMLLTLEAGRRLGLWRLAKNPASAEAGLGAADGAIFALFGLLLAFTFSGAAERFNSKRQLIAQEANDIGTAYLRLDLLPEAPRQALRASFRDYLGSRLETYRKIPDMPAVYVELARSQELQGAIWTAAVGATRLEGAHPDAGKLLLPALNSMIDVSTTRTMADRTHPAPVIFYLLVALALGCALLAGHAMAARKERSWLHILSFVVTTVLAIYVILDLEYPRVGLFRIDAYDYPLIDLLASMK